MPFKNKDQNRKYQKEWQRRKKRGENTHGIDTTKVEDTPPPLSKITINRTTKNNKTAKRQELKEIHLGDCCVICNRNNMRLSTHRKDGSKHIRIIDMNNNDFMDAMTSGDYARLCNRCHLNTHWNMKYLNINWKMIEGLLNI